MKDNVGPRRLVCPCHQAELARAKLSILDFSQFLAIAMQRQSLADTIGLQMVGSLTLADGGARLHLALVRTVTVSFLTFSMSKNPSLVITNR